MTASTRPPRYGAKLLEILEERLCRAGETILINFQTGNSTTPQGYRADVGFTYGPRTPELTYGWSSINTGQSRERLAVRDQRLDTLIHFRAGQTWEMALPSGRYEITASIGDASNSSTHTLNVEKVNFWQAVALEGGEFLQQTKIVEVTDGRLTLDQGAAPDRATRINYLHVVGLGPTNNTPPVVPTIHEPIDHGEPINPADAHLEIGGYQDADGDAHRSTDWQIWTDGPQAELVWEALGIEGVEKLHTHLGDGLFQGSLAGQTSLRPGSSYQLQVRVRDAQGSVSSLALRPFRTGAANAVTAMYATDVLPTPAWLNAADLPHILPGTQPNAPQMFLEGVGSGVLFGWGGWNGLENAQFDAEPLTTAGPLRLVIQSGAQALQFGRTEIHWIDETNREATIALPAIDLAPQQRLDLWVAANGSTYYGEAQQVVPTFEFLARAADQVSAIPFISLQPGYRVEEVAGDFQLPVNIAFVPNPGARPHDPLFYVTELYGTIKVVTRDFSVHTFATDLLNFNPTGNFPGTGEQGLSGIVVDPTTGDLFVSRVTSRIPFDDQSTHYPQVLRFTSSDGGLTGNQPTVILDMVGESQGQSHQISNLTIGPDGKLYVHNGDGFDASTAQNLSSYRGKILRLNLDGSPPSDNPFYNLSDGIHARDYVFAYGFRNPFGGAWRASDGRHYEVENGPSVDRMARVDRGVNYLWNGSDSSMRQNAIYTWNPAHAPVNISFIQPEVFGGSGFPLSKWDHAFVSESGPTYAQGPQQRGKRIVEFTLDDQGAVTAGPRPFVEYVGVGKATIVGLAAGPDGLYFTELYKDLDASSPIERGARIFRVRFEGGAVQFATTPLADNAPNTLQFTDLSSVPGNLQWLWDFGDGSTSDQRNPQHGYAAPGHYLVRLTLFSDVDPGPWTLQKSVAVLDRRFDLNQDEAIDSHDAAILFADWGSDGRGDLDGDGLIDAADAELLFATWTGDPLP